MDIKNKILIFQRTIPHYRKPIFEKLNKALGAIPCFGRNGPPRAYFVKTIPLCEHYKMSDFYPFKNKEYLLFQNVIPPLFKYKPNIVVVELGLLIISNWLLFIIKPFFGFKIILWTHGYDRKRGLDPKRFFADKIRIWLMNWSDAVITYSSQGKTAVERYLKNTNKVFVVNNTLDTEDLLVIRKRLEIIGKEKIKKELGFNKEYNLIFIGRILKEKEPERLIEVFRIISSKNNSVALHFVGGGPFMDKARELANGLDVKFWGYITDDYFIGKLLFASDLVVIPGYVGLSIVHAFCFDKPIVTQEKGTNGPFHSPEIEYLVTGKTGFMVNCNNNQEMADVVINYLTDKAMQDIMKMEIRAIIETSCNIDNMLKGFQKAIDFVSS